MMIKDYIVVDVETTGLNPKFDRLIEIAAIKIKDNNIVDAYNTLVNPGITIPQRIVNLTGITDQMVSESPKINDIIIEVNKFFGDHILLGHNLIFDYGFIKQSCINNKLSFEKDGIDTLKIARKVLPDIEKRSLEYLCNYYNIKQDIRHRAYDDAHSTHILYQRLLEAFGNNNTDLFKAIQLQYRMKKVSPITNKQKVYLKDLLTYHKIENKIQIDELSKNEASRIIDKIISKHGRIQTIYQNQHNH